MNNPLKITTNSTTKDINANTIRDDQCSTKPSKCQKRSREFTEESLSKRSRLEERVIEYLPIEIWCEILSFCDLKTYFAFGIVSKKYADFFFNYFVSALSFADKLTDKYISSSLKFDYASTSRILSFAQRFAKKNLSPEIVNTEGIFYLREAANEYGDKNEFLFDILTGRAKAEEPSDAIRQSHLTTMNTIAMREKFFYDHQRVHARKILEYYLNNESAPVIILDALNAIFNGAYTALLRSDNIDFQSWFVIVSNYKKFTNDEIILQWYHENIRLLCIEDNNSEKGKAELRQVQQQILDCLKIALPYHLSSTNEGVQILRLFIINVCVQSEFDVYIKEKVLKLLFNTYIRDGNVELVKELIEVIVGSHLDCSSLTQDYYRLYDLIISSLDYYDYDASCYLIGFIKAIFYKENTSDSHKNMLINIIDVIYRTSIKFDHGIDENIFNSMNECIERTGFLYPEFSERLKAIIAKGQSIVKMEVC